MRKSSAGLLVAAMLSGGGAPAGPGARQEQRPRGIRKATVRPWNERERERRRRQIARATLTIANGLEEHPDG